MSGMCKSVKSVIVRQNDLSKGSLSFDYCFLEDTVISREVTVIGFPLTWFIMRLVKLERSKLIFIQYKCGSNDSNV